MLCIKCGAENLEDDIFCTNCGAVLVGVSLDDPEQEEAEVFVQGFEKVEEAAAPEMPEASEVPEVPEAPAQQVVRDEPVPVYQPSPEAEPVYPQRPVRERKEQASQPRQRKRRRRNPRGIEWIPVGGAVLALLFLFLPWFSVFEGLQKWNLVSFLFDLLEGIGNLGFLDFMCIALYLIVIAAPVMIVWFAWRRDNNYMGLSLLAIGCAVLANIFTRVAIGKGAGFEIGAGFYLYILAIAVAIAGGVMISMQRQKNPRRRAK